MKLERSNVEFAIWRKKVDKSLFEHNGTTIPDWASRMWGLKQVYGGITSRKAEVELPRALSLISLNGVKDAQARLLGRTPFSTTGKIIGETSRALCARPGSLLEFVGLELPSHYITGIDLGVVTPLFRKIIHGKDC